MGEAALAFLGQSVRIAVPLVLAALGGVFSERSGVVNIALEGIILNGAFCAVIGTWFLHNPWAGVAAAMVGGALTALIHAVVTIRYKADQIISGVAINLFAVGVTRYFLQMIYHSSSNSERVEGFAGSNPLLWLVAGIIVVAHLALFRTPWGLRLRAVGEHPAAADTLGVPVRAMRYSGVLLSGVLAGLGGAWLAFDQHQFTEGMSAGRGFIALAALIFGKWTPFGATGACLLFGAAEAAQIQMQGLGVHIPTQFIQMMPYLLTMVVLVGAIGRATPPAALGVPYGEGNDRGMKY